MMLNTSGWAFSLSHSVRRERGGGRIGGGGKITSKIHAEDILCSKTSVPSARLAMITTLSLLQISSMHLTKSHPSFQKVVLVLSTTMVYYVERAW